MTPVGSDRPDHRLHATLASGDQLVPGVSPECPGPDPYGAYACVPTGAALPCAGATWHYRGEDGTAWAFVFRPGLSVCPAAMLAGRSGRLGSTHAPEHAGADETPVLGSEPAASVPEDGVRLALTLARTSLLSHPSDAAQAARAIQAALGWSIQRARGFMQVNRDHLPRA